VLYNCAHRDPHSPARAGFLDLPHGRVQTPVFMPVGTNATVKAIDPEGLEDLEVRIILANAYHLYLRPGAEVIRSAGGLHAFMGWQRNILTDSGGYQIFSLASLRRITEEGAEFRSHLDGSARRLTPEEVVAFQMLLGSDVLMPLDICTPPGIGEQEARQAVERTLAWAGRSLAAWKSGKAERPGGQLFGIVQGNFFPALRRQSAEATAELDFPGLAIGGLSVGESFEVFRDLLALTAEKLPADRPRYLMGVGTPEYILEAVGNGIDMMDCVFPTRNARNAQAFTRRGTRNLRNEVHRLSCEPIDPDCSCPTCRRHSRSYLRHLFKSREILAAMLATRHNLHFLMTLMQDIRQAIQEGRFSSFKRSFLESYQMGLDEGTPDAEQ
jgi:queuine tRNA-ribosyltransferase